MRRLALLFFIPIITTSCALMEQRSYYDIMTENQEPMWVPNRDFQVVSGDTGRRGRSMDEIMQRTPASYESHQDQEYAYSIRSELVKLENIQNEEDYETYDRYRHRFGSDSEKIYYLRLHPRQRHSYLSAKGFLEKNETEYFNNPRAYAHAYEKESLQAPVYEQNENFQNWMPRDSRRAPASLEYGEY